MKSKVFTLYVGPMAPEGIEGVLKRQTGATWGPRPGFYLLLGTSQF